MLCLHRIKLIVLIVLVLLAATTTISSGLYSQGYGFLSIQLEPVNYSTVADLSYIVLVKPMHVYTVDFDDINNESLPYIIARTQYSASIRIPSPNVYVSNGWLILKNTHHMLLLLHLPNGTFNPWGRVFDDDLVIYVAYVRFLSGASRYYARGGIGLYEVRGVSYDYLGQYYVVRGYWISVLGRFTVSQKLSYDFEGHWSLGGYRWVFSESVTAFKFNVNKTYALWIAKSKEFIVGGIIELGDQGKHMGLGFNNIGGLINKSVYTFYIRDVNTWPGIVAWKSGIAIKRIEVYSIKPLVLGQVKQNGVVPSVKLVSYTRLFNMLKYERLGSKTYYWLFNAVDFDPTSNIVYYVVHKVLGAANTTSIDLIYEPSSPS